MSGNGADPVPAPRRWGVAFAGIWLFYLLSPLSQAWAHRHEASGVVGIVATLVFAIAYLAVFTTLRMRRMGTPLHAPVSAPVGALMVLALVAIGVVMCFSIGQKGTAAAVYVCVSCVICLPARWMAGAVLAVALGTFAATVYVPGWSQDDGILFGCLAATLAVWGITQAISRNLEMLAVREENAQLALSDERNRFARDLHDILGHSLTVITVKAELADRLFEADPQRARTEVRDLERLSRDALADVRRAVEGYRELTLPGELSRARSALEAAEIEADVPNSTDEVPGELRELFAWTVREGITNVIRHSGARRCRVRLAANEVEIVDDGNGPTTQAAPDSAGHGLLGLRERASSLGGTVITRTLDPGFSLKVLVP